jgi:hypothetical protein
MPYFEPEGMEREYKAKPMPYFGPEGMERDYKAKPMPYYEDDDMGLEAAAQGAVGEAIGRKKGGMVRGQGAAIKGTKFKGIF